MQPSDPKRTITSLAVLIVSVFLVGGSVFAAKKFQPSTTPTISQAPAQPSSKPTSQNKSGPKIDSSAKYKDGSYSATSSYQSPGGVQHIMVKITLAGNQVSKTSAAGDGDSYSSRLYQMSFIKNYKKKIIGKKLSDIKLDHVGTSSLTSQGFNDALKDIANQAKG